MASDLSKSTPIRKQFRVVWEQYLKDRTGTPLLEFVAAHLDDLKSCGHEFPYVHRICDVILGSRAFRITRCVTCGEELAIAPIPRSVADVSKGGVPYGISAAALTQWVEDELRGISAEDREWGSDK